MMNPNSSTEDYDYHSFSCLKPIFKTLKHIIRIENFLSIKELARKKALPNCYEDSEEFFEKGTVIYAGEFGEEAGLNLRLWLCPDGDKEDQDSLTITISNESNIDIPDLTKLSLLDDNGNYAALCKTVGICRAKRGYVRFFFKWTPANKEIVKNLLQLQVELQFLQEIKQEKPLFPKPVEKRLHHDFYKYFKSKYIDFRNDHFKLKIEDFEFPAQRSLLAARSRVFDTMLTGGYKEAYKDVVKLENCDASTMEALLNWMQYDELKEMENWKDVVSLLLHADKFECLPVVDHCICWLYNSMCTREYDINDIVKLREISMSINCPDLARKCEQVVADLVSSCPKMLFDTLLKFHPFEFSPVMEVGVVVNDN